MSFYTVVPNIVRRSKLLTAEEKEVYYELVDRLNERGFVTPTNAELAKVLFVSEKTITARLASMKKKGFINIVQNNHKHRRQIYFNLPRNVIGSEEEPPTDEELADKAKLFKEALKKAIVFGTIDFNILIEKLHQSPYLESIKDNTTQFTLTKEQILFLSDFIKLTNKEVDCQISCFKNINYDLLLRKIKESNFLLENKNLNLKWLLQHYKDIVADKYKHYEPKQDEVFKKNFKSRNYSDEEIENLFNSIDDVAI